MGREKVEVGLETSGFRFQGTISQASFRPREGILWTNRADLWSVFRQNSIKSDFLNISFVARFDSYCPAIFVRHWFLILTSFGFCIHAREIRTVPCVCRSLKQRSKNVVSIPPQNTLPNLLLPPKTGRIREKAQCVPLWLDFTRANSGVEDEALLSTLCRNYGTPGRGGLPAGRSPRPQHCPRWQTPFQCFFVSPSPLTFILPKCASCNRERRKQGVPSKTSTSRNHVKRREFVGKKDAATTTPHHKTPVRFQKPSTPLINWGGKKD